MDRFEAMRVFVRVAERRSFTHAANDLELPRSTVTDVVKNLELHLGVRLLERTTRVVRTTLDGEAYYQRCLRLLSDLEDTEAGFRGGEPEGMLKVDLHGTQARFFLLPGLGEFLHRYRKINLHITERHQPIDMVREGYDCLVRVGQLTDSSLIRRKLAELDRGTFASPAYIEHFGRPEQIEDLREHHTMIGLLSPDHPTINPLAFTLNDRVQEIDIPTKIVVESPETNVASACAGLGLIQVPKYRVKNEIAQGLLVEVLSHCPPPPIPVQALYLHTQQLSPRLRVFLDWLRDQYDTHTAKSD